MFKGEEKIIVKDLNEPVRIDLFLTEKISLSRSAVQRLIKHGNILVNNKPVKKPGQKLKNKDIIFIKHPEPEIWHVEPEKIPLDIIYEDQDLIVLNKPKDMVVHPGAGRKKHTLAGALLSHCGGLSEVGGKLRPGIVHRLDKDTSGIMIVAKNDKTHINLSQQFSKRNIKKEYIALVHGNLNNAKGIISTPVGRNKKDRKKMAVTYDGKPAETRWEVLKKFKDFSLLKITPLTGRTHQIRVHMASTGHPVVGDQIYGKKNKDKNLMLGSQFLHALKIGFRHPKTGQYIEFSAKIPSELKEILKNLK